MNRRFILSLCFFATMAAAFAQPSTKADKLLTASLDSIMAAEFKANEPGAVVIAVRKGQVIYKKAAGMADMELNVAIKPDMIFRLGSITKQFTAVAILQLAAQGKLSLQDDIKKYMPDLPFTETITVEHLLHHTSGIKSYTDKPDFFSNLRIDKSPMEVVNLTSKDSLEFKPGSQWDYNNTGYVMLGYIIEKVSGQTYEDYVQQYLFKPAGMTNSYYGSEKRIILNRVKGYGKAGTNFLNSEYISMTLPYAAGSLLSTVEDLWKWNKALYSYQLIKKEWLDKALTPYTLPDGKSTNYGYGLSFANVQGIKTIEHGGGIPGFSTDAVYLPKEEVFVAMFSNCECKSASDPTAKIAAAVIGKPYNFKAVTLTGADAKQYEGIFENETGEQRIIKWVDGKLTSKRGDAAPMAITASRKDQFFFENSLTTVTFLRNAAGNIEALVLKGRADESTWKKSAKPVDAATAAPSIIKVDAALLADYAGNYALAPEFILTITVEGNQLFAQATGQGKLEVNALSNTRFKTKGVDAVIEFFQDANGKTESLKLFQAGREMPAKKQ